MPGSRKQGGRGFNLFPALSWCGWSCSPACAVGLPLLEQVSPCVPCMQLAAFCTESSAWVLALELPGKARVLRVLLLCFCMLCCKLFASKSLDVAVTDASEGQTRLKQHPLPAVSPASSVPAEERGHLRTADGMEMLVSGVRNNRMLGAGFRKHLPLLLQPLTLAPLALSPSVPPANPQRCWAGAHQRGDAAGAVITGLVSHSNTRAH